MRTQMGLLGPRESVDLSREQFFTVVRANRIPAYADMFTGN